MPQPQNPHAPEPATPLLDPAAEHTFTPSSDPEAYTGALAVLEELTLAFAGAAEDARRQPDGLARAVPACPGWSIEQLVDHLAQVHRWAAATLGAESAPARPPRPAGQDPVEWYRASAAHLLGRLRSAGPAAPAWTMWGEPVAAFWARRQVHETCIHVFDILDALGRPHEWRPDPALPVDGIREILFSLYPRQVRLGRTAGLAGVVRFEVTHDAGLPPAALVSPGVGEGAAGAEVQLGTVAARAEEVYLGLWGRRPLPGVPAALAEALRSAKLTP
ncbi:maleylpyruvate isomerase family mycothiol-dependent enzyme [Sinomonas halotolerans]|uniref:Maleylpyruvate isomerase family mycothiol-dependent enzyme n=1 Tax=Sinomonas halotolerans TaxID=1644133 RepID=A0ABU9X0P5_9MICC